MANSDQFLFSPSNVIGKENPDYPSANKILKRGNHFSFNIPKKC